MKNWTEPGIGSAGFGEGDASGGVGDHGFAIVLDVGVAPDLVDRGVAVDAELDHEAFDGAEEGDVLEVADLDEVVEAVGSEGRPVAIDGDFEVSLGGSEKGVEGLGGFFGRFGGVGHGGVLFCRGGFGLGFGFRGTGLLLFHGFEAGHDQQQ